jgi:prophage regulatory protein
MQIPTRLLRRRDVEAMTGLRRSAIYDLMAKGRFPKPVALTDRAVAWPESEVAAWINARLAESGRTPPP